MKLPVPLASETSLSFAPAPHPAPAPLPGFDEVSTSAFQVDAQGSVRCIVRAPDADMAALGPSTTTLAAFESVMVSSPLMTGIAPPELRKRTLAERVTPQNVWKAALSA